VHLAVIMPMMIFYVSINLSYCADVYDDFYVSINLSFVCMSMMWYHSIYDKIWPTPQPFVLCFFGGTVDSSATSSVPSAYLHRLRFIWNHRHPFQRGTHDPSKSCGVALQNPNPDDYFSSNWGIENLAMMILFPTVLNDESGLSETSVAAWTISYDIGYMTSSTSRTIEHWKAINSATHNESNLFFQFLFLFENFLCTSICRQPDGGT
jgi:hypothetical protein